MLPPSPSPCCHLSHFGDGDVPSGAGGAAPGSAGGPIGVGDGEQGLGLKAALSCGVGIIRRIQFLPCLTAAFSPGSCSATPSSRTWPS